jgi:hypothetical protein
MSAPYQFVISGVKMEFYNRIQKREISLERKTIEGSPVLQFYVNDSMVTVMFRNKRGLDVKKHIRNILTKAYEERFQKEIEKQEKSR